MIYSTAVKNTLNRLLQVFGLRLITLTAQRAENERIKGLRKLRQFTRPVYPLLTGMVDFSIKLMAELAESYTKELEVLMSGNGLAGAFRPDNTFFGSSDAEVLYLMVRSNRPKRIVEIGSGNSARVVRQAISDGTLDVEHIAIDPSPRSDIADMVDNMILSKLELVETKELISSLGANDILFIDSSHEVRIGNDVAKIFCEILPALASGVVVHVHDIFLPYDYQEPYPAEYPEWGEQYLLQAFLERRKHELMWPGFYLEETRPEDYKLIGLSSDKGALSYAFNSSYWFRVV
jgi:predicted O-methyltransferase YrrM